MASVSNLKKFEKFYLTAELEIENYSASDALLEFVNAYPEVEGLTVDKVEQYIQANDLVYKRKLNVDRFLNLVQDQVKDMASKVALNIQKGIEQTIALELTVINNMILELASGIKIDKLPPEEKVKLLKVVMDRSAKMQEVSFKMQKENLGYAGIASSRPVEDSPQGEPVETKSKSSLPAGTKVSAEAIQAAKIAVEHTPIPRTPPPSTEQFAQLQKLGDKIKANRQVANQEVDDDE